MSVVRNGMTLYYKGGQYTHVICHLTCENLDRNSCKLSNPRPQFVPLNLHIDINFTVMIRGSFIDKCFTF